MLKSDPEAVTKEETPLFRRKETGNESTFGESHDSLSHDARGDRPRRADLALASRGGKITMPPPSKGGSWWRGLWGWISIAGDKYIHAGKRKLEKTGSPSGARLATSVRRDTAR